MDRRKALRKTGLLVGASLSGSTLIGILNSCQSQPRLDWIPEFLSIDEANIITTLVDTILPKTDTPGALDVKVDMFLDKVFARLYDQNSQSKLRKELKDFDQRSITMAGDSFFNLSDDKRSDFLNSEEKSNAKYNPGVWGTTVGEQEPIGFYRSIKSMALWAYFSSEEIGKNVLNYDPIPGSFQGCIQVAEIGNKWSL